MTAEGPGWAQSLVQLYLWQGFLRKFIEWAVSEDGSCSGQSSWEAAEIEWGRWCRARRKKGRGEGRIEKGRGREDGKEGRKEERRGGRQ